MKLRRRKMLNETVELNITAFLNLMVILVPFLLITAVFSRMTVLELTLPGQGQTEAGEEKVDLELQMLLYPNAVEIRDANFGRIKRFEFEQEGVDWSPIADVLLEIKRRFPEEQQVALLLDKSVPYKRLIEAMDHVRSAQVVNFAAVEEVELFPAVSVGEAPAEEAEAKDVSLDTIDAAVSAEERKDAN